MHRIPEFSTWSFRVCMSTKWTLYGYAYSRTFYMYMCDSHRGKLKIESGYKCNVLTTSYRRRIKENHLRLQFEIRMNECKSTDTIGNVAQSETHTKPSCSCIVKRIIYSYYFRIKFPVCIEFYESALNWISPLTQYSKRAVNSHMNLFAFDALTTFCTHYCRLDLIRSRSASLILSNV